MSTVYRVETGQALYDDGVSTWVSEGTMAMVEGVPMVRMAHGTIVPADGWSATKEEARMVASLHVESIGRKLLEQAKRMRAEAVKEFAQ